MQFQMTSYIVCHQSPFVCDSSWQTFVFRKKGYLLVYCTVQSGRNWQTFRDVYCLHYEGGGKGRTWGLNSLLQITPSWVSLPLIQKGFEISGCQVGDAVGSKHLWKVGWTTQRNIRHDSYLQTRSEKLKSELHISVENEAKQRVLVKREVSPAIPTYQAAMSVVNWI